MGYCGCMGYEALFPANQLGGLKNIWNLREYGVCEPWVTRESTVPIFALNTPWFAVVISDMTSLAANRTKIRRSRRACRLSSRRGVRRCGGILRIRCGGGGVRTRGIHVA